jgi:hypothetical protein
LWFFSVLNSHLVLPIFELLLFFIFLPLIEVVDCLLDYVDLCQLPLACAPITESACSRTHTSFAIQVRLQGHRLLNLVQVLRLDALVINLQLGAHLDTVETFRAVGLEEAEKYTTVQLQELL